MRPPSTAPGARRSTARAVGASVVLGLSASTALVADAAALVPNDPEVPSQYGLRLVDAPEAWDISTGSPSVGVALVDDGVDLGNRDLTGNLLPGYDFADGDADASQSESVHGTQVASLLAATGNNVYGMAGIAWSAGLMPLKVRRNGPGERFDLIDPEAVAAAFRYAGERGFRVANASLSLRSAATEDERNAVLAAIAASPETLFVVSAGNNGRDNDALPRYPCNFDTPNLLCVAATDETDGLWAGSNIGATSVDLAAPGVRIRTTAGATSYGPADGTSYAAPLVSGTAALYFARYPAAAVADARNALLAGVDQQPALVGKTVSGGRLNAARTLAIIPAAAPPPPPQTVPAPVVPPAPGPPPVVTGPAPGSVPATFKLRLASRQQLRYAVGRGVLVAFGTPGPATFRISLRISSARARQLRMPRLVGSTNLKVARNRGQVRVRLKSSALRRLRRHPGFGLRVSVTYIKRPSRTRSGVVVITRRSANRR